MSQGHTRFFKYPSPDVHQPPWRHPAARASDESDAPSYCFDPSNLRRALTFDPENPSSIYALIVSRPTLKDNAQYFSNVLCTRTHTSVLVSTLAVNGPPLASGSIRPVMSGLESAAIVCVYFRGGRLLSAACIHYEHELNQFHIADAALRTT
nr:hypothetical protein CFP56_64714 [Quercus suber]